MTASASRSSRIPVVTTLGPANEPAGRLARHAVGAAWVVPIMALAAVVQAWNMLGNPQRIDDEGTSTARAWAITHLGELTHSTYWYDHPPLGWIQIAGWTSLTRGFDRYPFAVDAGREAMVFFTVVSVLLLFLLGRKLRLSRAGAAIAPLIFALSPLAVQYHRTVYIDDVATPWLIAAFVLALSRRHQFLGFAGAAACLGVAVLSEERALLALPFLIWTAFRRADPSTRRSTLSVAGAVLAIIGGGYLLLAAVRGELVPGAGRVSLWEGVTQQLVSRDASGSVFDPSSLAHDAVSQWWRLDPVLIVLGSVASIGGLFLRRVRPIAAMIVFLLALMFRPNGYLPVSSVIMLIPFGALLVGYVIERATVAVIRQGRIPVRNTARGSIGLAWLAVVTVAAIAAVPLWSAQLRGLLRSDLDQPMRQAETWVGANVDKSSRLLVDDAMWVDLVDDGFARNDVIWYADLDTDGGVEQPSTNGWRDSDYVVTTHSMRTGGGSSGEVREAVANSVVVASFGDGDQEVDVRRIHAEGAAMTNQEIRDASDARTTVGTEIARNPRLDADARTLSQFRAGRVDARAVIVLGQLLAARSVHVDRFTPLPGEDGQLFRRVRIDAGSASAAQDIAETVRATSGSFAPATVSRDGATITMTFSASDPTTAGVGGAP